MADANSRWRHRLAGAGIGILAASAALAQSRLPIGLLAPNIARPQNDDAGRQEYLPQGIDIGGTLNAKPKLDLSGQYDDNVFRTTYNASGDVLAIAEAEISVQAASETNPYGIYLRARTDQYRTYTSENSVQYTAGVWGMSEIGEHIKASAAAGLERLVDPRGSSENLRVGTGAVTYTRSRVNVEAVTSGLPIYGYQSITYDDYIYGQSGGVDNRDRNRQELTSRTRIGYELSDATLAFAEIALNQRDYARLSYDGYDHTSQGYRVLAGLHYEMSDITFLDISAGFLQQSYRDRRFATVSDPAASISLGWRPFDPLLVSINLDRRVDESDLVGTSGILTNTLDVRFDYDLAANLMAGARLGYATADFETLTIGAAKPSDSTTQYGFDLRYLFNPHLHGYAGYASIQRKSNRLGLAYRNNQVSLGVSSQW